MKQILVRSPNWIGDQVLSYPFFFFLRRAYPQARIVSVCAPWVSSVQFRGLVDEVYELPKPAARGGKVGWRSRFQQLEAAARDLRARGEWDLAISLPDSFSSAYLLLRSGAKIRRGYRSDGRSLFLNQGVVRPKTAFGHRADAYLRLLPEGAMSVPADRFWGHEAENELDPPVPDVIERFADEREWPMEAGAARVTPPSEPYWVLAPGSLAESRRWPLELFAELAREIRKKTGWIGCVVGGASEAPLADALTRDPELGLLDLTAQGGVPALTSLFRGSKLTVSNDSGLAHVASLCGSPVQIVWGAGDPKRTQPLGPGKARALFNPIDCWPCERNICAQPGLAKLACLRGIRPSAVWEEIQVGFKPTRKP